MEEEKKNTETTIDVELQNVKEHFATGVSKNISYRKQQLSNLIRGLKDMESEFLLALKLDLQRSEYLSKVIEYQHLISEAQHIKSNLSSWAKAKNVPTPMFMTPALSYVKYEPLGVVLIMNAWNYPLMGAIQPLATAIGSGNMAIIKTSEVAKSSSKVIVKLVQKYLDKKAYKVIEGEVEVSKEIITKPFDLIAFTGSSEKGKLVAEAAAKNLTPCILELGGKCPAIIDKCANIGHAISKILVARFSNSGQTCVATDYVLVHDDVSSGFKKEFTERLVKELKNSQSTPETSLDSDKGGIINEIHVERIKGYLSENHEGKVLCGVKNQEDLKKIKQKWIPPTIIEDPSLESKIMTEEIFGPVLPIISYTDIEEAIKFINQRPKPLAVYYFGCPFRGNGKLVRDSTSSGAFVQNEAAFQAVHPYLPFGGVGESGYGSYHGEFGFKSFSHPKACMTKLPLNFYPFNVASYPFTGLKEFTVMMFLKFGQIGQKKLIKRIIQLLILFWIIKGFATGTFQKKWRVYKPMIMMVWGMVKPKFLR
ncbi:unnamed protein product [Moneuplotes crassus]|uniref:Aldehyde dehydrogenase n=1 Tax=Euplotes crassus TaxID=5936 RepID=A0AAD1X7Q6_EUPCR|nr:unnamed protein product [Moneuplotes crassus]